MNCEFCKNTGVWETGNNDLPCPYSCPASDTAMFNCAGISVLVSGAHMRKHLLNFSPEPLTPEEFCKKYGLQPEGL